MIGAELYGVVLFTAVATTAIALPFLKWLYATEVAARGKKLDVLMLAGSLPQKIFARLGNGKLRDQLVAQES